MIAREYNYSLGKCQPFQEILLWTIPTSRPSMWRLNGTFLVEWIDTTLTQIVGLNNFPDEESIMYEWCIDETRTTLLLHLGCKKLKC